MRKLGPVEPDDGEMVKLSVWMLVKDFELCFQAREGSRCKVLRHSILISPMFIIKRFLFE